MKRTRIAALSCAFLFMLAAFAFQSPQSPQSGQENGRWLLTIDEQAKIMSDMLNLTEDQRTKLKPILTDSNQQQRKIKDDSSLSEDEKTSKLRALREVTRAKIRDLLNEDQKKKLDNMKPIAPPPQPRSGASPK